MLAVIYSARRLQLTRLASAKSPFDRIGFNRQREKSARSDFPKSSRWKLARRLQTLTQEDISANCKKSLPAGQANVSYGIILKISAQRAKLKPFLIETDVNAGRNTSAMAPRYILVESNDEFSLLLQSD